MKLQVSFPFISVCLIIGAFFIGNNSINCQDSLNIPSVFVMGDYKEKYAQLSKLYPETLVSAAGNDMNKAYLQWMKLQVDMEQFAESIDFDLDGIHLWVHAYWAPNGKLDYLMFFPKPNSKNVPTNEIRAFLLAFQRQYFSDLKTKIGFSHYASAHFPTVLQSDQNNENSGF